MKIKTFVIGPIETNCYLVYDNSTNEAILIDPAIYDKEIAQFIKKNNINIKFIVNTHGHYDHIGGDREFGYPVLIHEKDKDCLYNPMKNLGFAMNGSLFGPKPYGLLKEGEKIEIDNISLKVIHTPGHTPGGITLECGDVLFTGDTLFCEGVGRTDLPFSNERDLHASIKKLMQYSDQTIIYPGHGPSSTIGHERKSNPFITG